MSESKENEELAMDIDGKVIDPATGKRDRSHEEEDDKIPPATPNLRDKKLGRVSTTPCKNNVITAGVITPVDTKKPINKPFTRYIKSDHHPYTLTEYKSAKAKGKGSSARKVMKEANHYYKLIMDIKYNDDAPSRDQILESAIRTIRAGTCSERVLIFIMNIQQSERNALVTVDDQVPPSKKQLLCDCLWQLKEKKFSSLPVIQTIQASQKK